MWKKNGNSVLTCLFEVVIGILLLISPIGFTSGIIISVGVMLCVVGVVSIAKYIRADALQAAKGQWLFKGLTLLLTGGFCMMKSHWFIVTFPLFTMVYGVGTLLAGLSKVQWTMDMIRLKEQRWFVMAIGAILSIVCAIIILTNPFSTTAILWTFTGVSLIVEAGLDAVALIARNWKKKKNEA